MSPLCAGSGQSASICYVAGEGSKPAVNPRFPRRELLRRAWPSPRPRPVAPSTCGAAARIKSPERNQDAEDDRLRPRRAARDMDIDRQNLVDAAGARVSLPDDAPEVAQAHAAITTRGSGMGLNAAAHEENPEQEIRANLNSLGVAQQGGRS